VRSRGGRIHSHQRAVEHGSRPGAWRTRRATRRGSVRARGLPEWHSCAGSVRLANQLRQTGCECESPRLSAEKTKTPPGPRLLTCMASTPFIDAHNGPQTRLAMRKAPVKRMHVIVHTISAAGRVSTGLPDPRRPQPGAGSETCDGRTTTRLPAFAALASESARPSLPPRSAPVHGMHACVNDASYPLFA
jgi:hypothetical protein